jgi:glycosyltransferase involved in cell wall biosynthesis
MARVLGREHEVMLVTTSSECRLEGSDVSTRSVTRKGLRDVEAWCDVLVFQGVLLEEHPWLRRSGKVLVADVYDPFHLEVLEQLRDRDDAFRVRAADFSRRALNAQLRRGDFFLCASPKQRDLWLGQLAGLGRINPATYDVDNSLRALIDVVPFGTPDEPPLATARVLKGVVPGIAPDDKVILWGGGVYNWFDPLSLVRAVHRLHGRHPDVRLFFLGMKHPNPEVAEMRTANDTRVLAEKLGLTGNVVFFNEGWVPYDQRQNFLLESDIGVSTHHDHIETEFSFRTRILDYLWAGLPVVATGGDALGELIDREGLGCAVPPGDEVALEAALERLLYDDQARAAARAAVQAIMPTLTWSCALGPLLAFCRSPERAADLVARGWTSRGADSAVAIGNRLRFEAEKVPLLLNVGGPALLGRKVLHRLYWTFGRGRG